MSILIMHKESLEDTKNTRTVVVSGGENWLSGGQEWMWETSHY